MAGSLSDYLENTLLDYVFGNASFAATLYIAAYTSAPTDAGGGTEVAGGSYVRKAVTNNSINFPAASGGVKSNGTVISFAQATAAWGDILAIGIFNAVSGGDLLAWSSFSAETVNSGDTLSIGVGDLDITMD